MFPERFYRIYINKHRARYHLKYLVNTFQHAINNLWKCKCQIVVDILLLGTGEDKIIKQ